MPILHCALLRLSAHPFDQFDLPAAATPPPCPLLYLHLLLHLYQASQDFDPRTRRVVNRGQLLGEGLSVSAAGSYAPADTATRCPKLVRASIEAGCLQAWGREIQLPIR